MSKLCCDKCGDSDSTTGMENVPEHMRQFVRGEVVITMNPLGICGECYTVLCSQCAHQGKCSVCGTSWPLLSECPTTPPDDPVKYAKWNKLHGKNSSVFIDDQKLIKKWWQFWK